MKGLTQKQQQIVKFIQDFIDKHSYSPSYREIMTHFQFSSLGSVYKHLKALKRKGHILAEKGCSRTLLPNKPEQTGLPLIGTILPEGTFETFSQIQTVAIPSDLVPLPDSTYVIRVRGDTLNKELIGNGDLILIEARESAYAGELVLASNEEGETQIQRFTESLLLKGVVIGLVRLY